MMIFSRQQNPTMQMRPVTFLRVLLLSCVHVKRKPITAPFFILLLFFFCTFLLASLVAFFSFSEIFGGKVRLFSCCVGITYGCPLDHFTRSCIRHMITCYFCICRYFVQYVQNTNLFIHSPLRLATAICA